MAERERPNCLQCLHFVVQWEPPVSRACKAYEFSADLYPSQIVLESSGRPCQLFSRRQSRAKDNTDERPKRRFT